MAKVTQNLKTGMTVLTGGNVPAYTLEYLSPAKKKKTGEFDTIIIPYIEIGRANNCNVQYGEEASTVSRRHAAIERRGSSFFLVHLSATNPSLINGQPVNKEAQLNNGDEIQLSMEGPKLRFNTTASGTSNMGFTKKINLLIAQSTRQYKTAMYSLLVSLVVVCSVGAWFIFSQHRQLNNVVAMNKAIKEQRKQDSIQHIKGARKNARIIAGLMQGNKSLLEKTKEYEHKLQRVIVESRFTGEKIYDTLKNDIYFLEVREVILALPSGEAMQMDMGWTGTAFLCDDGKLVTARHCIQGWRYFRDPVSQFVSAVEVNGGKVKVKYRATSKKDWFEFGFDDVVLNDKNDMEYEQDVTFSDGIVKKLQMKAAIDDASDWAYYQTNRTSNIHSDGELSTSLKAGEKLYVLGFSLAIGGPTEGKVSPLYSESSVAQSGISESGLILISNRGFEQGNSGGPVFVKKDSLLKCVGIVSIGRINPVTGEMSTIGGLVPIANIE